MSYRFYKNTSWHYYGRLFLQAYVSSFPDELEAAEKFTYPGPKPFSKETAFL